MLTSINTAQNDVEIMGAYETATRTLKGILAKPELDINRVEQTTEDLAEAMASQEEVDSAIRTGGSVAVGAAGMVVDEDELERELEGLVLDESRAKEEEKAREAERAKEREQREEREKVAATGKKAQEEKESADEKRREDEKAEREQKDRENAQQTAWQDTYEAAQQRQRDEVARAEVERMRREEKRVAAE